MTTPFVRVYRLGWTAAFVPGRFGVKLHAIRFRGHYRSGMPAQ
ncbi:hypothetical protein NNL21_33095 [Paenibacillus mendelii]|nr:hypothetical protein [Paenibacillus mendelii]